MSTSDQALNMIQEYFINIFRYKYILYQGRARRKEYWMFALFSAICGMILGLIPVLGPLYSLAAIVPSVCLGIRRLHDIGKSGWWVLIFYGIIIAAVLVIFVGLLGDMSFFTVIGTVGLIAGCIIFLVFLCQDSQPGANQYGPNPKGT
jgi:uncharacterized membrane protein YhaH (DUF805 family)